MNPTAASTATSVALNHSPRQALQVLLDGLAGTPQPIRLVLDDLHRVHNPAALELLAVALERSPANLQWMLLSRHAMPFSMGRLRLQYQVHELDSSDLLLQRSEIEELLILNDIVDWDSSDIELLAERTQGWISGIHLALLSLGSQDGGTKATIDMRDLLSHVRGDNVLLAEYLTGELLIQRSEEMRSFLLQCSIVHHICADLCDAIRGQENSARLLQQAFDERLMLQPLDDHGEWYALHHLFREMLLRHLRKQYTGNEVRELHRRAAAWLLRQGDIVGSLNTLLAGGDLELAAELVQSRSRPAILHNSLAELRQWVSLLPAKQIDARPQLLLDLAWMYSATDQNAFVPMLARTRSSLAAPAAPAPQWQDELAALTLLERGMSTDQRGLYDDCITATAKLDADSHFAQGWIQIVATLVGEYQSPGAPIATHIQMAAAAFAKAGYALGEITVLARQAKLHMSRGAAEAALNDCAYGLQLSERMQRIDVDACIFFSFLAGEILYWQNKIDQAASRFNQTRAYAQQHGEEWYLLLTNAALQLCDLASGRTVFISQPMLEEEDRLWQQQAGAQPVGVQGQLVHWQMMRWLALGEKEQAWRAFQRAGFTVELLATSFVENTWLALLTAYVTCGRELASLTPLLEKALQHTQEAGSQHIASRIQLLLARQQQQLGNAVAARTALRAALHEIEQTGYIRMVLNHPELAPVLRVVNTTYARKVLAQINATTRPATRPALTEQEATILALLAEAGSNEEIAERLVLSISTVKWHLNNIYKKLGVKNRWEAIAHTLSHPVP